jgi:outer membrane usher protein
VLAVLAALVSAVSQPAFSQAPTAPASGTSDQERQKLFQQFFGRTPQKPVEQRLDLPLVIDGKEVAEVPAVLPENVGAARISAEPLLKALKAVVTAAVLDKVAQQKDAEGYLRPAALRAAGLGAKVDPTTLSLAVSVPGQLRRPQVLDMRALSLPSRTGVEIKPATLSGYVNLHGALTHVEQGTTPGRQPLNLQLDDAINYNGEIIQNTMNYIESGSPHWQRGNTRFVHDDPARAIRYQAGDLNYPTAGFQTFSPLGGLSFARDFTLTPYDDVQPSGQQRFILESPSKVEVLVNGQPAQVLRLPPGQYDIRNFPFAQGANDVQLA